MSKSEVWLRTGLETGGSLTTGAAVLEAQSTYRCVRTCSGVVSHVAALLVLEKVRGLAARS